MMFSFLPRAVGRKGPGRVRSPRFEPMEARHLCTADLPVEAGPPPVEPPVEIAPVRSPGGEAADPATILPEARGDTVPAGAEAESQPIGVSQVDPGGLRILGVRRFGLHARPTRLSVAFSRPLDQARAENRRNYLLIASGPDLQLGTRDDQVLPFRTARYDAGSQTVRLGLGRAVPLTGREYVLAVNGTPPTGLTDTTGQFLDGGTGSGTDAFALVDARNFVPPPALTRALATPSGLHRTPPVGAARN